MVVGNVIGSNIFNLLWILGISAAIQPIPYNVVSNFDILDYCFQHRPHPGRSSA